MSSNFKNKCQNIPIDSCLNEKMCHIKEINPQEDCIDTNQIPFPINTKSFKTKVFKSRYKRNL